MAVVTLLSVVDVVRLQLNAPTRRINKDQSVEMCSTSATIYFLASTRLRPIRIVPTPAAIWAPS